MGESVSLEPVTDTHCHHLCSAKQCLEDKPPTRGTTRSTSSPAAAGSNDLGTGTSAGDQLFFAGAVTMWQERDRLPAEDRATQAAQPEIRLVLISLGAGPITSSKLFIRQI